MRKNKKMLRRLSFCERGLPYCGDEKTDEHCICLRCVNCKNCPCKTKCDYDTCALQGCSYCFDCFPDKLPFYVEKPPSLDRLC